MYLFFDTETTGLPKKWDAPIADLDNWPRVVQLGYQLYSENRELEIEERIYISPPNQGFDISPKALAVHKITNEILKDNGVPISEAIGKFISCLNQSKFLIAHNIAFDRAVLGAEFIRCGMKASIRYDVICTKELGTDFCKIPSRRGYKWPKLEELHRHLFQCDFEGAHDALDDVRATAKCFFGLMDEGVLA